MENMRNMLGHDPHPISMLMATMPRPLPEELEPELSSMNQPNEVEVFHISGVEMPGFEVNACQPRMCISHLGDPSANPQPLAMRTQGELSSPASPDPSPEPETLTESVAAPVLQPSREIIISSESESRSSSPYYPISPLHFRDISSQTDVILF